MTGIKSVGYKLAYESRWNTYVCLGYSVCHLCLHCMHSSSLKDIANPVLIPKMLRGFWSRCHLDDIDSVRHIAEVGPLLQILCFGFCYCCCLFVFLYHIFIGLRNYVYLEITSWSGIVTTSISLALGRLRQ